MSDVALFPHHGQHSRVILAAKRPARSPLHDAVDAAADWARRRRTAVAVLMLRLSRLGAPGPQPHHRRVASALLDSAAVPGGGQVFACGNGDLVLLTDAACGAAMVPTLCRLFRAEAPAVERLVTLWCLPDDEAAVRAAIADAATEEAPVREAPVQLGAIALAEAVLRSSPVEGLWQRQMAVRIAGRTVLPAFEEVTFDLAALERAVGQTLPEVADPFLSRHLAGLLDDILLAAEPHAGRVPLHINLTPPGALSPGFASRCWPRPVGVELQMIDAMADPAGFAAACEAVRAAGHAVVIDGIDHMTLLLTRPEAWRPAILKLDWSPRLQTLAARESQRLGAALAAFGPGQVVLHRAETEAALAWGLRHGITCFQGRHVDAMLAAERITHCPYSAGCSLRECIGRAAATGPAGRAGCHSPALLDGLLPEIPALS